MTDEKHREYHGPAATITVGNVETTGQPCEEFCSEPCGMVIFGASGDLAKRKLIPSLYRLSKNGLVSKNFFVLGTSRAKMDDESFRSAMEKAVREDGGFDAAAWAEFSKRIFYTTADDLADGASYDRLKAILEGKNMEFGTLGNRMFYLATPPSAYAEIADKLGMAGMSDESNGWSRLVIEKPFGRDLKSALELNETLYKNFKEEQIYRIDHYLGKDTVQNILMLRFANTIFEPIWNRRYIDHVQITVAESIGIEKRAGYYEEAGILRDMFQNHILQILALVAMEPPAVYESELVRDERVKVLRALRPLSMDTMRGSLVVGQYTAGEVDGKPAVGYRDEEGVPKDSVTPTFAAMKVFIDNWRWQDVPFYIRSGKRFPKKHSEILIQFKPLPHRMFKDTVYGEIGPNALILMIQPDERVQLKFHTKNPGSRVNLRDVIMDFSYKQGYAGLLLDAYERVILDCMLGDKMLFVREDGMRLCWSFLTEALELIGEQGPSSPELLFYGAGSPGPIESDFLIQLDGRLWRNNGGI
ncbi:MAG: glucose-6-phosphate dehydrogenase [Deltaproteobacteria bacterium]|nr:glucose-6-phosphate dehydrogenase [Deltaproteobacteria bacterium]